MSFKKWSAAQSADSENKPDDKATSAADQPATETEEKPAEVGPVLKS
jgi:hypothetical protein